MVPGERAVLGEELTLEPGGVWGNMSGLAVSGLSPRSPPLTPEPNAVGSGAAVGASGTLSLVKSSFAGGKHRCPICGELACDPTLQRFEILLLKQFNKHGEFIQTFAYTSTTET